MSTWSNQCKCYYCKKYNEGRKSQLDKIFQMNTCCVFRPVNACLRMRSHGRKRSKTFKNHEKHLFHHAHEEKRRKTKKNFVGQRLGVTPKSWSTPNSWLLIWNLTTNIYLGSFRLTVSKLKASK